jgi:hypothetical protein
MIYRLSMDSKFMVASPVIASEEEAREAYKTLVELYTEICKGEVDWENLDKTVFKDGTTIYLDPDHFLSSDAVEKEYDTERSNTMPPEYLLDTGGSDELPDEKYVMAGFHYPVKLWRSKDGWRLVNKSDMLSLITLRFLALGDHICEMGTSLAASAKALNELSKTMEKKK